MTRGGAEQRCVEVCSSLVELRALRLTPDNQTAQPVRSGAPTPRKQRPQLVVMDAL
jgi:hypothetical protein